MGVKRIQEPADDAKRLFCMTKGMRAKDIGPCDSSSSPQGDKKIGSSGQQFPSFSVDHPTFQPGREQITQL
jgi:hypothetical protein